MIGFINRYYCLSDRMVDFLRNSEENLSLKHHCLFVMSCLRNFTAYSRFISRKRSVKHDGWVSVITTFMGKFMGNHNRFRRAIDCLLNLGFIEVNWSYQVGSYSRKYRIKPEIFAEKCHYYTFEDLILPLRDGVYPGKGGKVRARPTDVFFNYMSDLTNLDDLEDGEFKDMLVGMVKFYDDLSLEESGLDAEIEAAAVKNYEKYINSHNDSEKPELNLDYFRETEHRVIDAIKNKETFCHVDSKSGRIYHPVVNLSKRYRHRLRWRGQILHNIDVKTCQPLLLASFYDEFELSHMYEKEEFIKFCLSNDFYTEFARLADPDSTNPPDRPAAKIATFVLMFGTQYSQNTDLARAFEKKFPILSKILKEIRFKNYKKVSAAMQKKEADIMIRGALSEFRFFYPDQPIFSIHDSFLVLEEDIPAIIEIIKRNFAAQMGFEPQVSLKD